MAIFPYYADLRISPDIPAMAAILDAQKALDSLEWLFLHDTLQKLGIPGRFTALE